MTRKRSGSPSVAAHSHWWSRAPLILSILAVTVFAAAGSAAAYTGRAGGATKEEAFVAKPKPKIVRPAPVPRLEKLVPASVRSAQPLVLPTDDDYPPSEFLAKDGHTITGASADLLRAVLRVLNLRSTVTVVPFAQIIPGFQSQRYMLSMATLAATSTRAQVVDFVAYTHQGSMYIASSKSKIKLSATFAAICGHTVAVLASSNQLQQAQQQSCPAGQSAKLLTFPTQDDVNLALASNRAEFAIVASGAGGYLVKHDPQLRAASVGFSFGDPAGWAIAKGSGVSKPVSAALAYLMKIGYYQRDMRKWGLGANLLKKPQLVTG